MDARKLEEENMWQVSWDAPKRRDPRRWATVAKLGKKIVAAVVELNPCSLLSTN